MIVFDLLCEAGHRFEGWFGSADDFGAQKARGILACPGCGSRAVERVPSATRFNAGAEQAPQPVPAPADAPPAKDPLALAQMLYSRMLDEILTKARALDTADGLINGMNMLTGRFARLTGENVVTASMSCLDAFHYLGVHELRVDADAEIIMFSPQHEHSHVIDHMIRKVKA